MGTGKGALGAAPRKPSDTGKGPGDSLQKAPWCHRRSPRHLQVLREFLNSSAVSPLEQSALGVRVKPSGRMERVPRNLNPRGAGGLGSASRALPPETQPGPATGDAAER